MAHKFSNIILDIVIVYIDNVDNGVFSLFDFICSPTYTQTTSRCKFSTSPKGQGDKRWSSVLEGVDLEWRNDQPSAQEPDREWTAVLQKIRMWSFYVLFFVK